MAKKMSKEMEWRTQGMIYALNIAKKDGVEALEKDIRQRGFLRAPLSYSNKQLEEFWEFLSKNLYASAGCGRKIQERAWVDSNYRENAKGRGIHSGFV